MAGVAIIADSLLETGSKGGTNVTGVIHKVVQSASRLAAARHWNRFDAKEMPTRIRWWESPRIIRHVNSRICCQPIEELGAGLVSLTSQRFPGRTFSRAISVGCGTGMKEMMFVQAGLVDHFHLFELSVNRINSGEALASSLGISDRVTFHNQDGLADKGLGDFDMVYWKHALHHMFDVDRAVAWSRDNHQRWRPVCYGRFCRSVADAMVGANDRTCHQGPQCVTGPTAPGSSAPRPAPSKQSHAPQPASHISDRPYGVHG